MTKLFISLLLVSILSIDAHSHLRTLTRHIAIHGPPTSTDDSSAGSQQRNLRLAGVVDDLAKTLDDVAVNSGNTIVQQGGGKGLEVAVDEGYGDTIITVVAVVSGLLVGYFVCKKCGKEGQSPAAAEVREDTGEPK